VAPRVFISHAYESDKHAEVVRDLWVFLRANGVGARLDRVAAQHRQDWTLWMEEQADAADHILVIASPAYKHRAGPAADPDTGRGVQYEARLLRNRFYQLPAVFVHWYEEPTPARRFGADYESYRQAVPPW
jgi:hypothetical protein